MNNNANIVGKLEYRDYVVHVFTGILLNLFLLAACRNSFPWHLLMRNLPNQIILSLIAIPVLFLEGHFLLAIDRFFFIDFPSWIYEIKDKKTTKGTNAGNATEGQDEEEQEPASYRMARENLYDKCKGIFILLFGKRIIGRKTIRERKDGPLVKTKKDDKKNLAKRYYVLSDFFKGVGLSAWIALIVACTQKDWPIVAALGIVIVLAWLRCRFCSMLYVKYHYAKKKIEQKETMRRNEPNATE